MGKGGQQSAVASSSAQGSKLDHLPTEELRKWAKAYACEEVKEREDLLELLAPYADGIVDPDRPKNLPLEPPTFTLSTIKNAIPAHCFKRNLYTGLKHLASDVLIIALLGYAATFLLQPTKWGLPSWAGYVAWPLYWYAQGAVMTGVWVIAHECGHQSFSESELANNIVGTLFHSLLLVPYHPWRITHAKHHGNTGSCEHDEVFAPATRSAWASELLRESPIAQAWGIVLMLTVGWLPGYLVFNATGPAKYKGKNVNHFSPTAVFFKPDEYWLVVQSNVGWFSCVGLLGAAIYTYGIQHVMYFYLLPYFVVNYHLVLITYLQHTDVFMPHFRGKEFNWLRGALCTVDRSFGPLLDHTFHHITDTHVCHHLFSKMPFYHAQEATEAIKGVLGAYYMKDDTSIARALYRSFSCCQFIEDDGDIVFYKNKK
ncbi:delta12-fatty acid desaturase [Ochromonadaceae sp. CCMP2298]|nr:delta12-fatty acid desaturase [Ochromonadaceae sp. CCMP2298]|mmetsp:Transcript_31375/g.67516  ORF Transcript_31375/g.67516 Transcript_31375/m.67516 type:complete len:428 (+) Transcript_31375:95-1378(+)